MAPLTPPRGAPWLVRAFHELQRRRHLVLHGNVEDLVRWNNVYQPFTATLNEFLAVAGFDVIVRYNLVDGLSYYDDKSRDFVRRFLSPPDGPAQETAPEAVDTTAPAGAPEPDHPLGHAGGSTARRERLTSSADALQRQIMAARQAEPRTAVDVFAVAMRLMAQGEASCVLVIDSADLLVGNSSQLAGDHLAQVAYVRRLLGDGTTIHVAEPRLRNTMVFVVRDLASLPGWLHRDNPNVAAVLADKPGVAERAAFVGENITRYYHGDVISEDERTHATTVLANLTDGMTIVDIGALGVTSIVAKIEPTSPRRLVARHRFGLRDDPWEQLDIAKVRSAEQVLSRRVMGQPAAVRAVTDVLMNARGGLDFVSDGERSGTRPKGVFFFVGPTGVGKTELAKALAELVFDDESALRRFDMSEYSQEHNSERLIGAPPGYVGHDHGGTLTNWVLERPFSVLLFDEIEKAHEKIMDKFLQIIDDGRLTDGQGRTAHFSHSIVIFTSNLGAGDLRRTFVNPAVPYDSVREHFGRAVAEYFSNKLGRPELLGRLGSGIVVFDILRNDVVTDITAKFLDQIAAAARARGYDLVFDRPAIGRAVIEEIARSGAELGARQIRSPLLEQWVQVPLNRWIVEHQPAPGARILVHRTDQSPPFAVVTLRGLEIS